MSVGQMGMLGSAAGSHLLTGGSDGTVRVWSLATGERVRFYVASRTRVTSTLRMAGPT